MSDLYMMMPRMSGADEYKKNGQDAQDQQSSQLFKTLLQQTMQQGGSNTPAGALMQGLGTYLMMQQNQPQTSTDQNSPNFMGPPTSLMEGFGGS